MLKNKNTVGMFLAIALMATLAGPAAAAEGATLVGSWEALSILDSGEEAPGLFTFNRDRTWTATASDAALSNAHGAWKPQGARTYAATNKGFIYDSDGTLSLVITNRVELEVSTDGDSFTAEFVTEISLPSGGTIDTFSGTATGTRIVVEPF